MAASTATHSYSSTIGIDATGGVTYVTAAEVREINGPGLKVTMSDRSHLVSDSAAKEKTAGFIDQGSITLKLNFTKAQYALFLTMLRKPLGIKITLPLVGGEVTASSIAGKGLLSELGQAIPEDDTITNDVTLEATGLWVFTPGS